MPRRSLAIAIATALLVLAACRHAPEAATPPQVLLLGEVHDNAGGHRQRLQFVERVVERRIAAGQRPAIAMEQFDRERQPDLDRAMQQCTDAACVIAAAAPAKAGWNWPLYEPVIMLALRHRLPLLAANVSRADAAKVLRGDFASALDASLIRRFGLDRPLPADLAAGQSREIDDGHCGKLPPALLPGMVRAQVARDAWMAQLIETQAHRGVILLAGNGHVRRDLGVPRWLPASLPAASVGYLEAPAAAAAYDLQIAIKPQARPDPCAGL